MARYLNHAYTPKLLAERYNENADFLRDLSDTQLTHARLVELFGTKGIDINDALASSVRLEVMARRGIGAYHMVSQQLEKVTRPGKAEFITRAEQEAAIDRYIATVNQIARETLGSEWPANYVNNRLNDKRIKQSYFEDLSQTPAVAETAAGTPTLPKKRFTDRTHMPDRTAIPPRKQDTGFADQVLASAAQESEAAVATR